MKQLEIRLASLGNETRLLENTISELKRKYGEQSNVVKKSVGKLVKRVIT